MLTKMTLENFLSFQEKTEFDFIPSKYTILNDTNVYHGENSSALKGALFIGPNASGKTNALKGIMFLLKTLEDKQMNYWEYICRFGSHTATVTYEFSLLNRTIVYRMEFGQSGKVEQVLKESLTVDGERILVRSGNTGELYLGGDPIVTSPLDEATTYLRTASFNTGRFPQRPELRALMDYLMNSSYITGELFEAAFGTTITHYAKSHGTAKVNEYLNKFQYDFFALYTTPEKLYQTEESPDDEKYVFLMRKSFPVPMPIWNEAQGNKVFLDLLPHLIDVIERPGMLIIDEFGNSLHNYLAEKIVRFFMEQAQNSQFFITSHCTNLISNSVFRPDQIDLVTFPGERGSQVERISKFKPREAQNLEKMYLGGMFAGLPNYGEEL